MERCERCNRLLILIETCDCKAFKIESECNEMYEFYALTEEAAALDFAQWSNTNGDYYLMDSEEIIKVNGVEYIISAEPDVHYSACKKE